MIIDALAPLGSFDLSKNLIFKKKERKEMALLETIFQFFWPLNCRVLSHSSLFVLL